MSMIEKYFKRNKKGGLDFIGDKLVAKLPTRYQNYGYLDAQTGQVTVLGIFEIEIDDTITDVVWIPAVIVLKPSISESTQNYNVCTFYKGDTFIDSGTILKSEALSYLIYNEFIYMGKLPTELTYQELSKMFQPMQKLINIDFGTDAVIFEILATQLSLNTEKVMELYSVNQKADANGVPVWIPLKNFKYSATSMMGKIGGGSYLNDGITSSGLYELEKMSDYEKIITM